VITDEDRRAAAAFIAWANAVYPLAEDHMTQAQWDMLAAAYYAGWQAAARA
jgi:hypothetical protein